MTSYTLVAVCINSIAFVDTNLKNDSSTRAANAVACASDAGKFLEYHSAVFAAQPVKEGDGYTDAQLTEFATTAGITGPALTTWHGDRFALQPIKTSGPRTTNPPTPAARSQHLPPSFRHGR